jgi:hypothetical protein
MKIHGTLHAEDEMNEMQEAVRMWKVDQIEEIFRQYDVVAGITGTLKIKDDSLAFTDSCVKIVKEE